MANRLNIENRICPICGKDYKPARKTTLACSRVCSDKVRFKKYKREYTCDCCGSKYIANKHNNNRREYNYCSGKCALSARWKRDRNSHKVIGGQVCKICSTCKKWIPVRKFREDKSKWDILGNICRDCYRTYAREVFSKTEKGIIGRKQGKANRRARKKQAGRLTTAMVKQIYDKNVKEFEGLTCVYCLKSCENDWHLEHKIPLCRGGLNKENNLTISCPTCNLRKARQTDEEYNIKLINQVRQ